MRVALRGKYTITPVKLPNETKQLLLKETEPIYWQIILDPPARQDGADFPWLVAPFKLSPDLRGQQTGAGVLCQTETEAKETFDALRVRNKKHLVSFLARGIGGIAWMTNLRRFSHEIRVMFRTLPVGKVLWLAIEREVDLDTLEVTVIRRKEIDSEGEANYWAEKWLDKYNKEKKAHFDSIANVVPPPPPPHCTAITKLEIEDLGKAKTIALQRQWPGCFKLFEKQKSNPNSNIPDQEFEDAYLLDLTANSGNPFLGSTDGKIRADMELISALHRAAHNYSTRGKSKIIDAAIYMIAFNWDLGWCYFSHKELAEKLTEFLETPFTDRQAKNYLVTLGLYTKHKHGLPPESE